MTKWRRIAGAIALAVSMGSAWAGAAGRDQRLDIPWAVRTFAAAGKLTEQASNDPAALSHILAASQEIDKTELREFRRLLLCCVEGRGQSSPVDMGRATKNSC